MGTFAAAAAALRNALRRPFIARHRPGLDAHEIGAIGEAATEAALAPLRRRGFVLIRDRGTGIAGHHENIDHILVGPSGVAVVETKKYAADRRFSTRGGVILVDGAPTEFIAQVKRQVAAVSGAIGGQRPVAGVIVVHGARLERDPMRAGGVAIMSVETLLAKLEHSPALLAPDEVKRLTKAIRLGLPPAGTFSATPAPSSSKGHVPPRRRALPKGMAGARCPSCKHGTLVLRRGDFPDFLGCSSYHSGLCHYMARPA